MINKEITLLFILLSFMTYRSSAQVDSFYKNNKWWYCYEESSLPVRRFYPKYTLQAKDSLRSFVIKLKDYGIKAYDKPKGIMNVYSRQPCLFEFRRRSDKKLIYKKSLPKNGLVKIDTRGYPFYVYFDLHFYDENHELIKAMWMNVTPDKN